MQSSQTVYGAQLQSISRRVVRFLQKKRNDDTLALIGIPLLIAAGAILGVINMVAFIYLVALIIHG